MNVVPAFAAALALAGVLSGCGHAASMNRVEPNIAGKPTWGGCRDHVQQAIDYAPDAPGSASRAAALASYRTPGDHVVVVPAHDHLNRQWLLVDDANVIHTAVELWHGEHDWLVGGVERCAD